MNKMKETGIIYIGKIPHSWKIGKIKYYYKMKTGFTPSTSNQSYYDDSEAGIDWITISDLNGDRIIPNKTKNHISRIYIDKFKPSIIKKGSLLYSFKLSVGQVALTNRDVYTNEAIVAFSDDDNICLDFLFYSSSLIIYNSNENIYGAKILNKELIKNAIIVYPPLEEQYKISNFLNKKCSQIKELYSDIEYQIETLEKYKKSIITEAVTKGLNPNEDMKLTESQYWKYIPKKWELSDIKYLFEIKKRIAGKEGYNVLSVTQKGLKIKDLTKNEGQIAESYANYQFVYPTDFVMNHMDLLTGWVDCSTYFGVTSPDYRVFSLKNNNNDLSYYKYLMQCCYINKIFYSLGRGVSNFGRWRLQTESFNNFKIPVPPVEEQKKISEYLDNKLEEIDKIAEQKKKQLKTLKDFEQSLIYEYVTGKKEV